MSFSHRSAGAVVCTIPSCRWRTEVEVTGGFAELEREQARQLEAHQRNEHPWKFIEFIEASDAEAERAMCSVCGVIVGDTETHRRWHQHAENSRPREGSYLLGVAVAAARDS